MLHFANHLFLLSRLLCWNRKYQEDQILDLIKEEGKGYLFPSTCKRRRYLPCWGSATLKCFQLHVSGCTHGHAHCPFALLFPTNNSLTCGSQQRHSTPWCILWSRWSRDWACGACWRLCTCSSTSAKPELLQWDSGIVCKGNHQEIQEKLFTERSAPGERRCTKPLLPSSIFSR